MALCSDGKHRWDAQQALARGGVAAGDPCDCGQRMFGAGADTMSDDPLATLDALIAAGAKATPGTVEAQRRGDFNGYFWWDLWSDNGSVAHVDETARAPEHIGLTKRDAEFLAAAFNARPALAALADEVRRLRARVETLETAIRDFAESPWSGELDALDAQTLYANVTGFVRRFRALLADNPAPPYCATCNRSREHTDHNRVHVDYDHDYVAPERWATRGEG